MYSFTCIWRVTLIIFLCPLKAWEMLMKSAYHEEMSREEIGLKPVKKKETPAEEAQSSMTQ